MLSFDSYREVLNEHARGHHFIRSAWLVVLVVAVLLIVFAYPPRDRFRCANAGHGRQRTSGRRSGKTRGKRGARWPANTIVSAII